jgi:two-component system nitrogen regulation response regulator GlnG
LIVKEQMDSLISQLVERGVTYEDAVSEFEKRFIRKMLEKNNGNRSKAAHALGIHRNTLSRKMNGMEFGHRARRRRGAR